MTGALLLACVWLFLTLSHVSADSFSVVVPETPVIGLLGSSVILPCTVSNNMDVRKLEVRWYRPPKHQSPALLYQNEKLETSTDEEHRGRVSLVGPLEKGIVSLKLDNLRLTDKEDYMCHVSSDRWYDKKNMSLIIQAVGSSPVLSIEDAEEGKVNVSCYSHGWLPKPSLSWRDSAGRSLEPRNQDTSTKDSDGFFSVSSWLMFSPAESSWLSCSVALSDSITQIKESRIMPHVPTVIETWKEAFITTLIFLLLLVIGIGVYCVLLQKGVIGSMGKKAVGPAVNEAEIDPLLIPQTVDASLQTVVTEKHIQDPQSNVNFSPAAETQTLKEVENQQLLDPHTAGTPQQAVVLAVNLEQELEPHLSSSPSAGNHGNRNNRLNLTSSPPAAENQPASQSELSPKNTLTTAEWEQMKQFKVNITIDPEETPAFFRITQGGKRVIYQPKEKDEEEKSKIFTLCKEKFSSGQQYWEVKVMDNNIKKLSWFVGVATDEAEREYRTPLAPQNGFWVLCYEKEKGFYIRELPTLPTPLPDVSDELTNIRVCLDCDNHTLSFYNADTQSLIYTYTNVTFKTSLRPLISPGIRDTNPVHICY